MEAATLEAPAPATALPPAAPVLSAPPVAVAAPPFDAPHGLPATTEELMQDADASAGTGADAGADANLAAGATEQTSPQAQQATAAPVQEPQNVQMQLDQAAEPALLPQTPIKQSAEPIDSAEMLPPPSVEHIGLADAQFAHGGGQDLHMLPFDLPDSRMGSLSGIDATTSFEPTEAASAIEDSNNTPSPDPMQAFAKLQFEDGDFYVNTYAIKLGRDVNALRHERRNKRLEQRKTVKDQEREGPDLDQESMNGDGGLFSFRRRNPAMSISNVSETGGIMGVNPYSDSEESRISRRRRKNKLRSSNSSHSVEPRTLHANPQDLFLNPFVDDVDGAAHQPADPAYECPLVPIHPPTGQPYKGISREHVKIEYSLKKGIWEMTILGKNGAYLDGELLKVGETANIGHGSEILIHNIKIIFKLPDNARDGEEEVQETYESDSSLSELASEGSSNLSSDDEPLRRRHKPASQSPMPRKIIKLKLSLKKAQAAGKLLSKKDKADRPTKAGKQPAKTNRPEKADKADKSDQIARGEKLEKEKVKAKEKEKAEAQPTTEMPPPAQPPVDVAASVEREESQLPPNTPPSETPPAIPAELPAGSVLIGVAPEDVPQKRKGPGRPPKNGVMSKRDEAIIKRKRKEFEKAGIPVPSLTELLQIARAEGSVKKDKPEDGKDEDGMKVTAETETPAPVAESATVTPSVEIKTEAGMIQALTQASPEKDPNKPKRVAKSPSPQKPESEYTEEELKKPTATYVVLIHEALSKSDTGVMDLQQIYDAMQKNWPWFKYRSQTHGWQSSVRHNLISSEAFQEAGKIGKGRLWKINPTVSIDKEKKRKAPTPPPERPAQQYPYYPNGQYPYGAPQPGAPGYPQQYRPSPYGTPYGPPTVPSGPRPPVPAAQQKPGTYYSPYASNPAGAGATHASPYGPPSRPPYAPYAPPHGQPGAPAQPSRPAPSPYGPPTSQPAQLGQQAPQQSNQQASQASQPPSQTPPQPNGQAPRLPSQTPVAGQPPQPQNLSQVPSQAPPPLQTQSQQPSDFSHEKMVDDIMNYHKRYIGRFAAGAEQDNARAVFRQATNRCLHLEKDHGPFASKDEEELTSTIKQLIAQSRAEQARASPVRQPSQMPSSNGSAPQTYQGSAPSPAPAPPASMQGSIGNPPQPQPNGVSTTTLPGRPLMQQSPAPNPKQAPQSNRASTGPEGDLVHALKTAMPGAPGNATTMGTLPTTADVTGTGLQGDAKPNVQAQVPSAGQTAVPVTTAATGTSKAVSAYQSPMPPRPVMASTSSPALVTTAPTASTLTQPSSQAAVSIEASVRPPVSPSAPGYVPAPVSTSVPVPQASVPTAAAPAQPANMKSTPTQTVGSNVLPAPADGLAPATSTTAPRPSQEANGSLKRPIDLDEEEAPWPDKKQKTT
ncbi:hypothetical protein MBLNU459_g0736t1 [Dothideomycetes sp. NU459]